MHILISKNRQQQQQQQLSFSSSRRYCGSSIRSILMKMVTLTSSMLLLMTRSSRQRPSLLQQYHGQRQRIFVSAWVSRQHYSHHYHQGRAARRLIHSQQSSKSISSAAAVHVSSLPSSPHLTFQRYMSLSSSSDNDTAAAAQTAAVTTDEKKTPEEMERIKAEREARKAEKERKKEEKKAKQQRLIAEQQAADDDDDNRIIDDVTFLDVNEIESYAPYGDMTRIMSRSQTGRTFSNVADLDNNDDNSSRYKPGDMIWLRGRLQSIRVKGGSCFLVLRQDSFHTIQACYFKDKLNPKSSQKMLTYLKTLTVESMVDIYGTLVQAQVKSCSIQNMELVISRIHCISKAATILPFSVEDASRSEQEIEASQTTDRPFPRLGQELRLDYRWMDLRVPANNAIMRIQSAICQLFRESLYQQGFIEIHTPKLIAGESESGAGVFTTDYFGQTACLAQSPQLYKQMAISSDLNRVFEIGPVFRAEKSHTRRHLCEFIGLDIEMSIHDSYLETLHVIHNMFKYIFHGLESRYSKELQVIREQYESEPVAFTNEPCILHWPEAMEILKQEGFDVNDDYLGDLTGAMELTLGRVVKERYNGTDFFMLDKYPSQIRPFYTMPDPNNSNYSNSYDIFLRGQEICSGAQRCHDPDLLVEILKTKGIDINNDDNVGASALLSYIQSFQHGVNPHAGAGIGLERVVFLYLGLDNVRQASMFPRDPNRCTP